MNIEIISDHQIFYIEGLAKELGLENENQLHWLFENNPDRIKVGSEISFFIHIDFNGTRYVILSYYDVMFEDYLKKFFSENWQDFYSNTTESEHVLETWNDYHNLENAIAFRGGKGYSYAILRPTF